MTNSTREGERRRESLLPRGVTVVAAFVSAAVLLLVALPGPLGLGVIRYWTSASGVAQTMGVDLVNLVLIAPILLIGGALLLARKEAMEYFKTFPDNRVENRPYLALFGEDDWTCAG